VTFLTVEGAAAMNKIEPRNDSGATFPAASVAQGLFTKSGAGYDDSALELDTQPDLAAQADRRNTRSKLAAGWRGIKSAVRGDSSFFAHGYRGTLIAITAALLGIDQRGWCLLVLAASLVLIAELAHSAVDTLARAIGDPEELRLKTAREIAAGAVLVAAFGSAAVTLIVLSWKFAELLAGRS
jgi:diacylglycerol kinase